MSLLTVHAPADGRIVAERPWATPAEVEAALARGAAAGPAWRATPLAERIALLEALVAAFEAQADEIARELALQIGRPLRFGPGEVAGFGQRARAMLELAPEALAPLVPAPQAGFRRMVTHEPLGLVLVLSPWNYPYLTAVNAVIPALAAGNTVLLKHSDQTPLCAERMVAAGRAAGLPEGVFEYIHMDHGLVARAVADARVGHVAFTGSVAGGHAVVQAASRRFLGVGLELGGKDPAYVRADADLAFTAPNVVEGALFNSGQSCCAVERVYVHEAVYDDFVEAAVAAARGWVLGDPLDPATTLGPMVRARNAEAVRAQVAAAVAAGARPLLDASDFPAAGRGGAWLAPQLLVEVSEDMALMTEETFGPVVGIARVSGDAEALARMNASRYGLTASLWTRDVEAASSLAAELQTGTVFLNRCDYLDPYLAWTGVKDSGRGCTLSRLGYQHLTRPKSLHFRLPAS